MKKYYIVTETGGDLMQADIERSGVEVGPMHVQMEGESRDDGAFPVTEIFEIYRRTKVLPKTSATNPHEYKETFDRIKKKTELCPKTRMPRLSTWPILPLQLLHITMQFLRQKVWTM